MRSVALLLVLTSFTTCLVVENVFFNKITEFSMSNSRWLLTFAISIDQYDDFLTKLSSDIDIAAGLSDTILSAYAPDEGEPGNDVNLELFGDLSKNISEGYRKKYVGKFTSYHEIFYSLRSEINLTRSIHTDLVSTFADYKMLQTSQSNRRQRRALFGFLSPIFTEGFGLLDQASIDSVKRNVRKLASNQKTIQHTLQDSISVINASSFAIRENRQKINEIVSTLSTLNTAFIKARGDLNQKVINIEKFLYLFSKLNLILDEIKSMIQNCIYFYLQLEIKLNILTLERFSANIVPAEQLKTALIDLGANLPATLDLPKDPVRELFDYYKFLKCATFLQDGQIVVVTEINLIEHTRLFELYQATPLMMPYLGLRSGERDSATYYQLESRFLAINRARTLYFLMSENEVRYCRDPLLKSCNLKRGIMNVYQSVNCIVSLFIRDKARISKYCELYVTQTDLPQAIFVAEATYFIMTNDRLTFHVNCKNENEPRAVVTIDEPYGTIEVNASCIASSQRMTLVGTYENRSNYTVTSTMKFLKELDFTSVKLRMDTLTASYDNGTVQVPQALRAMKEFPLNTLRERLSDLEPMEEMPDNKDLPFWAVLLIVTVVILAILFLKCCCQKYFKYFKVLLPKALSERSRAVKKPTRRPQPPARKPIKRKDDTYLDLQEMAVSAVIHSEEPKKKTMIRLDEPKPIIRSTYPGFDVSMAPTVNKKPRNDDDEL